MTSKQVLEFGAEGELTGQVVRAVSMVGGANNGPEPYPEKSRVCAYPECTCLLGEEVEGAFCAIHKRAIAKERDRLASLMANPEKCARKGCDRGRVHGSIWCTGHRSCDASVACDGLPAAKREVGDKVTVVNARGDAEEGTIELLLDEGGVVRMGDGSLLRAYDFGACDGMVDSEPSGVCPGCGEQREHLGRESGLCLDCCREDVETEQPNDKQGAVASSPDVFEQVFAGAIEAAWCALSDDGNLDPRTVAVCKRLRDLEVRS